MFKYKDVDYTFKFNTKKLKTIELSAKTSITGELNSNGGVLKIQTLEVMFSLSLIEESTNEVVKQGEALKMFEGLLEEHGFITINNMILGKLQDDMGFMFR